MKFSLDNEISIKKAKTWLIGAIEKKSNVEMKTARKQRKLSQNAYYWVVLTLLAMEVNQWSVEEWAEVLKLKYDKVYVKGEHTFLRSTKDMDTKEMAEFITCIRNYASKEHNCFIPSSEEYLRNKFEIDKEIENARKYM